MKMPIEEFGKQLKALFASDARTESGHDGFEYFMQEEEDEMACELQATACSYLINLGQVNWENVRLLKSIGFDVFPGDGDSFGWLTGCIRMHGSNKILVFG